MSLWGGADRNKRARTTSSDGCDELGRFDIDASIVPDNRQGTMEFIRGSHTPIFLSLVFRHNASPHGPLA